MLKYDAPDTYRMCVLTKMLEIRRAGVWSVTALYTNKPANRYVHDGRETFLEAVEIEAKASRFRSLPVVTPRCNGTQYKGKRKGTAVLNTFQESASSSHFTYTSLPDNPGIRAALQRGSHEKELVEDSDTISNDSLVLLPTVLALVPIGLFQDVSLSLNILHIIATDIISVMPLLAKGIELIAYGSRKYYGTVSYYYGGENATSLAVAESRSAVCSMRPFVRRKGTVLVCLAAFAIVVGIIELLTMPLLDRYKRSSASASSDNFGFINRTILGGVSMQVEESGGLLWHRKSAISMHMIPTRLK